MGDEYTDIAVRAVDKPLKSATRGQRDARPTVTSPAAGQRRPLTATKLYCLATEARVCEQLSQGCYLTAEVEHATFCVASQHRSRYTARAESLQSP